jgi:hypothetical protein
MCDEAKLLADFVCQRRAKKEGKILGPNYWNSVLWKKRYQEQVVAAHSLLKVYSYSSIISALKHKDISWVYSLRSKQIIPYIKDEINRIESLAEIAIESKPIEITKKKIGLPFSGNKNKMNRLD